MSVKQRMEDLLGRVRDACEKADRSPDEVQILGAAKQQDPDRIREAYDAGLRLVGENRLREGIKHREAVGDLEGLQWHFIGPLQSRKCREVVQTFDQVQSVDRGKVIRLLDRYAGQMERKLGVLVEINMAGEKNKVGCAPQEAEALLRQCADRGNLVPRGLMCIPPPADDPEDSRPHHRQLRELRDRLQMVTGLDLPVLSMGMSHDLEVAIEEGATMIRVGTDLFGPRPSD